MVSRKSKRLKLFYITNDNGLKIRAYRAINYDDILIPKYWGRKKRRALIPAEKEVIIK